MSSKTGLSRVAGLFLCAGGVLFGCSGPTGPSGPAAPSGLSVQALPSGDIGVSWTDNSADEAGFETWRSTSGSAGTYTLLSTVGAGVTTLNDTGLAPVTQYCYKVRATGTGSAPASAFTAGSCATTPPPAPGAPSNLTATATSTTEVTVTWTDNSSDETGFEIWRSTTGASGTYTLLSAAAANSTSANETGLTPGTQYCYQVRALGGGGAPPSAFSNSACTATGAQVAAPSNLTASTASSTSIGLSWTDNSSNETGFEVWRSTTGATGAYSLLTPVAANATSANDTGLTSGAQYCYQVKALGDAINPESSFSSSSCDTPITVRVVLFGDSNTDRCTEDWVPTLQPTRKSSYVSIVPRLGPNDPHLSCSTPGKVEAKWQAIRPETIHAVNHAITSTGTGGNTHVAGDPDRSDAGSPNARFAVGGFTRFEAEVLGLGYPWSGGEPTNADFPPPGAITRVNAFAPGPNDFVYVSMGTNDFTTANHPERNLTSAQTEANLRWMANAWTAAGLPADHFIITTLPPRDDAVSPTSVPNRNTKIKALASDLGLHLIDLAAYVSDDNGATWRNDIPTRTLDGTHYTEAVRGWLADQIVAWMNTAAP